MKRMQIGTHNGCFHCDEVLAIAMLRQLPEYKNAEIIRSRDPNKYNPCDIVVDVGGVFDVATNRYDHHQSSFNLSISHFFHDIYPDVKLSSAGLVYAQFGHRIIANIVPLSNNHPDIEILFKHIYSTFVSEVDAIDNGIAIAEKTVYSVNTGLSSRVGKCNPPWNKPDRNEMECFEKALDLVEKEFVEHVKNLYDYWLPARSIVYDAFDKRFETHSSGLIMVISQGSCPWKKHFYDIEKAKLPVLNESKTSELKFKDRPVFALIVRSNDVSVTAIPISIDEPFSKRVPMPETWAGKRDNELDTVVGLTGCVFVHSNKFLGIHKTLEGALQMAIRALKIAGYLE